MRDFAFSADTVDKRRSFVTLLGMLFALPMPVAGPELEIRFCHAGQARCIVLTREAAAPFLNALHAVRADPPLPLRIRVWDATGEPPLPDQPLSDEWMLYHVVVLADPEGRPHHLLATWTWNNEPDADKVLKWLKPDIGMLFRVSGCSSDSCRLESLWALPTLDTFARDITVNVFFGSAGDPPVLHQVEWLGGSSWVTYEDYVVEFVYDSGNSRHVPAILQPLWPDDYRMGEPRDLDGDGRPELVLRFGRWTTMYDVLVNSGPWIETVRTVRDGRLIPACRDYPEYFAERIVMLEREIHDSILRLELYARVANTDPTSPSSFDYFRRRVAVAEWITEQFLMALQVGWFAPARRAARTLEAFLNGGSAEERAFVPEIRAFLTRLLTKARHHRHAPCVLDRVERSWDKSPLYWFVYDSSASRRHARDDGGAGGP